MLTKLKKYNKIACIEEHTSIGGLNSLTSELIAKSGLKKNFISISLPEKFGPTGTYEYLLNYHGLTSDKIVKKILKKLF